MIGINYYVLCGLGRCEVTPLHMVSTVDKKDRCDICCGKLAFKRISLVPEAYYWYEFINLLFSPHNLPWLAYAICNLCLYLFCNCKITNKVFWKFCPNFMGKEYEEWSGEILSCSLRVFELPVRAIKFLKWLIYDFSALKLAQPNPWLESY